MVLKSVNVLNKLYNMKKKILIGIFALGMTAIAAFNINLSINSMDYAHSTLSLANLEALAQNNDGEKKNTFSTIDCVDITIWDPATAKPIGTGQSATCSGDGTKECKCP